MSDETTPAPADELEVEAAAISDGAYTLFVADFYDTDTAWEAYELLKEVEDGKRVEIEGVLVVKRGADGSVEVQKATDHSTQRGLGWGVVGGVVLGVLFPPSIIGSAAVLGAAGAAVGRAREAPPPARSSPRSSGRHRPGPLRDPAAGVRPRRGRDPQGARQGERIVEKAVDKAAAEDIKAEAKPRPRPRPPP